MVAPTPSSPPQSSNLGIDLKHLKTISALAEQGSLAGAALTLNLTQSALSHQLKELEIRLNLELFLRKSRPLVLTAAGQQMLAISRYVFECPFQGPQNRTISTLLVSVTCSRWPTIFDVLPSA